MKMIISVLVSFFYSLVTLAQNSIKHGEYVFKGDKYFECLNLEKKGTFSYRIDREMLHIKTYGNWQIRNDSLILDSNPQKEKLIVWEKRVKRYRKFKINVLDKNKSPMYYSVFAIMVNGDTLTRREQFDNTVFSKPVKMFTIEDTKGLVSPFYIIQGSSINQCKVFFEHTRTFENERWKIINGNIIPKGLDGLEQKFQLSLVPR